MQHLAATMGNKKEAIENRSGIDKESFGVRLSLVYLFALYVSILSTVN
jgi:hypothetical protein